MGRRLAMEGLESRLRDARMELGLSQAQLAERAGLSRQAVSSIEGGHYVPNTAVALSLAHALHCSVEDLFKLPDAPGSRSIDIVQGPRSDSRRLAVADVGGRWIGYSLSGGREFQQGFVGADVLLPPLGGRRGITPLSSTDRIEHTAVLLGCDPSLGILTAHLGSRGPEARLLWLSASSQDALDAIARGEAHVAGTHLRDPDGPTYNRFHARRALGPSGGLVVEFARWELGLVVEDGNPKGIRCVADLARPDVRIVNRERGSGSRALFDELVAQERIPTERIAGYDRLTVGHMAAAGAVAAGGADAALALRAAALMLGLEFVPLAEMGFDFVVPRAHIQHPTVCRLLDALQSAALRADVGALPGYEVSGMGTIKLDLATTDVTPVVTREFQGSHGPAEAV